MTHSRKILIVVLVGLILNSFLVFAVDYPPIQDYPNHLLRRHVIENMDIEPYADFIALDPSFRPNVTSDIILAVLRRALDLELAGKMLLGLELLTISLGAFLFLRCFGASLAGAVLAVHLSASWVFLKGLINFGFGVGFGLAWLSVLWGQDRITLKRWVVAAVLGVATVASHGFAFLAFSFLIFTGHLTEGRVFAKKALARISTTLPGLAIFALFLLNATQGSQIGDNRFLYSPDIGNLILWNPLAIWARVSGMLDERLGAIAWALLLVALVLTGQKALGLRKSGQPGPMVTVWGFVLGSIFLYLVLPGRLSGGWGFMKTRICLVLFFVSLPLFSYLGPRIRAGAAAVALGVWAIGFSLSSLDYQRFDDDVSSYMEVARETPQGAVVLSLNFMDPGKTLNPYQHTWSYACIRQDCLSQELFADEYIQQIYFEKPLPGRNLVVPPYDLSRISEALDSGQYDAVLTAGEAPSSVLKSIEGWKVEKSNRHGTLLVPR
ncbi:MAG: hypothetical protein WBO69_09005 [Thermoanaerobaculia bacterium]